MPNPQTFANLKAFLEDRLPEGFRRHTLLDFGAGRDGYVKLYAPSFERSYALDLYDYTAEYEGLPIEFIVSDGHRIPLPQGTVDLVVAHSVLEHVADVGQVVREMDRVLRVGGVAYLTISPLFFSYCGGHINVPHKLENWEHLDPESEHFIGDEHTAESRGGHYLNRITHSKLLAEVGKQPWSILGHMVRAHYQKRIPRFLRKTSMPRVDLYTRETRIVAQKTYGVHDDSIYFTPRPPKA
ncbi:MAG: methyltransferase domain-containing protein [Polyangiaceae bacterium]